MNSGVGLLRIIALVRWHRAAMIYLYEMYYTTVCSLQATYDYVLSY